MILDTDVLIDLLRKRPEATLWLAGLSQFPTLSGMAVLETLYGARDAQEQHWTEKYIKPFPIPWPSEVDAQNTRRLARHRLSDGVELNDVITASIAQRHNLTLATFNVKHFRSIPGLSITQPYTRT